MVPPPIPQFTHLPANLAQQFVALPPLNPVRQRGRGRGRGTPIVPDPAPAFALAPAFELAPAPAPAPAPATTHYQHLPANLAQQLAALPALPQIPQRGRVTRNIPAPAPALAPAPFEEIMAQYAALPPVCFFIIIFLTC